MNRITNSLVATLAWALAWLLGASLVRAAEPPKPDPMAGHGGVSSVDQANGDYGYSIALALPFFRGLEPQVSLDYSSAGANGYVGVGWSLSGFGQIVRGAPSRWGSPSFSEHDTFSLDGNLLLSCASLGTPATVPSCAADLADADANHVYYATQIESYAVLYLDKTPGVNGGWGQWVRVDTRGIRKVYAAGYVVAQPASPNNVFKWLETTTNDPQGNVVEIAWDFNLLGDCCAEYPTKVIYHYPSGPKVVAEFLWERREDVENIALPNNGRQAFARLAAVDLASPEGLPLRAYDLDYAISSGTRRSLLASVDVYGSDRVRLAATATRTGGVGPGPAGTLIPTRKTYLFSYVADAAHASFTGEPGSGKPHYDAHAPFCTQADEQLLTGDFDGDGRTDLGCFRPNRSDATRLMIARSDGTRFVDANWGAEVLDFCVDGNARLSIADLDGDGKDDLTCATHHVSTVMSTGQKFVTGPVSWEACPLTGEPKWQNYLQLADYNGDGWTDLGCHLDNQFYVQRGWDHDGDGSFDGFEPTPSPIGWGEVGCSDTGAFGTGDFNGDGSTDLYCARVLGNPAAGVIRVYLSDSARRFVDMGDWNAPAPGSEGGGFCTSKHEWNIQLKSLITGDFNADGKTDLLCIEQDPNRVSHAQLQVSLSQGNSPGPARNWGDWPECGTRAIQVVGDVDGEGKTDLACVHVDVDQGFDHTYVRASTGRAFAPAVDWKPKWCNGGNERFFDVDGDSRVDLTCTHSKATREGPDLGYAFALAGGKHGLTGTRGPIDLLETITTPAGGTLAIGYVPASNFSNAFGPPPTGPVVTQVTSLDNQQYTAIASGPTTRYAYVGSRYDRVERRSLGYFETTASLPRVPGDAHPSAGPVVITQYLQDYGSLAKPLAIRKLDAPGGNVLTIDTFAYWVNDAAPYRSHLADEWHTSCGPGQASACVVRKQRHLSYCAAYEGSRCTRTYHDDHGNSTVTIDYGVEGSNPPPAITTIRAFARPQALATNLVEQPADVAVYQGVGNGGPLLSRRRFQYDQLAWGAIGARGERTQVEGFLASGTIRLQSTLYDMYGRITREIDALGHATTYEYDGLHRLIRTINPKGQDVGVPAFHPNCGTPTKISNLDDQLSTATYDAFCRITSTTDPLGPTLNYTYHDVGVQKAGSNATMRFKAAHASPGGVQDHSVVTYLDGLGRTYLTKVVAARPAASNDYLTRSVLSRTRYDARGNVSAQTVPYVWGDSEAPGGVPESLTTYDALDRVVESKVPGGGATTRFQYDLAEAGVWGSGVETVKQIDPLGTPSLSVPGMVSAGAFEKTCEYVAASPGSSGGAWHCNKTVKDLLGRVVEVWEPDTKGSPTQRVSSAEYDMLDRLVHVWDATRGHVYTRYDALGRPVRVLDARGTLTCFEYDPLGRPTREQTKLASGLAPDQLSETTPCSGANESVETWYDSYPASPPSNLSGTYYNAGEITMVVTRDAQGQITSKRSYGHDAAGRLVASVLEVDGKLFRRTMTYDAAGRPASTTFPDGDVITYAYDNQGNVIGLTASGTPIAKPSDLAARGDWQYDAAARLQYLELGNGTIRRASYDTARGWLTSLRVDKGSTNLVAYGYQDRNALGLLRSITSNNAAPSASGSWQTDHTTGITYDSQYRMLTATGDANLVTGLVAGQPRGKWTVTMRYSPLGEPLSRSAVLLEAARTPIGLQGDYCYSATRRHAVEAVVEPGRGCDPTTWAQGYAPPRFTYDAAGNMLTHRAPSSTIGWNGDGRPITMQVGGATQTFAYEGQGRRIKASSGSVVTYYDGDFEWSGTTSTKLLRVAGQVIARRTSSSWTPPSVGAGTPASPTWTTHYVQQNHLGSLVLITDAQGNPIARTIYSPWGERIAGTKTGSHGYAGEREDDTGLIFLNARYYDPSLSRFVSADPVKPGKSLGSFDRYGYANGNPLRFVDPSGHKAYVDPVETGGKLGNKKSGASVGNKKSGASVGNKPTSSSPPPSSTPAPPGGTATPTPTPTPHPVAPGTPPPSAGPSGPSLVTQAANAVWGETTSYMMASYTSSTPIYGSNTWTAQPGQGWGVFWIDENGVEHEIPFADAVKYAGIDPPDKRDPNMNELNDLMFEVAGERSYGQGQAFWDFAESRLGTDVLAVVCQVHDVQFEYGWAQAGGDVDAQHAAGGMSLQAMLPDLVLMQMLKEADTKIIVDGAVFLQKEMWRQELNPSPTDIPRPRM